MANILLPFFPFPFVLLTTFRVVAGPLLAPVATRRDETHKGMGNGGGGGDLESQDSSTVHTHTKRFPRKKIPTTTTGGGGNPTEINVFFQGNIGRRRQGGSNTAELCTCATPIMSGGVISTTSKCTKRKKSVRPNFSCKNTRYSKVRFSSASFYGTSVTHGRATVIFGP